MIEDTVRALVQAHEPGPVENPLGWPRGVHPAPTHALTRLDQLPGRIHIGPVLVKEVPVSRPINLYDAKTQLSQLVERAAAGEEIVIAKAGRPMARLVPLKVAPVVRVPGMLKGKIAIGPDFDAPLPADLTAAFAGNVL